ncbi:MAG: D-2-hydroxyacid dehydrogenase family protein, partial [Rhodobacteraceae bacterium]|nr:D-2-hydroxyacid dehydrogenase family protein [Paracoccaceae bacterium]
GVGRTLRGRTVGLYGYGRIARAVAAYAKAMGLKVQWWGSEAGRARAAAAGETVAVSREAFFKEADIVSLHVRLKPETRGLITAEDLAQMQPRALFVNTARSGLVAPGALEAEIAKGQLHAAVDVFDHEPLLDRENILLTHPNVLATPHIGFVTEDEFNTQFSDIFDQINAYAAGAPTHMINPEAYQ